VARSFIPNDIPDVSPTATPPEAAAEVLNSYLRSVTVLACMVGLAIALATALLCLGQHVAGAIALGGAVASTLSLLFVMLSAHAKAQAAALNQSNRFNPTQL
jgi:hypothetical protein